MAKKRKPSQALHSTVETKGGHVFTEWVDRNGRLHYRKDGRYSSAAEFDRAKRTAARRVDMATEVNLSEPSRTQRDIAYTNKHGEWRAGEDAKHYIPGKRKGAKLTKAEVTLLRTTRMRENNFRAFANLPENDSLSDEDLRTKYRAFQREMEKLKKNMDKQRIKILRQYWGY